MRAFSLGLLVVAVSASSFVACGTEEKPYTAADFKMEAALELCLWGSACCDSAEQATLPGGGVQAACESAVRADIDALFGTVPEEAFRGSDAKACVARIRSEGESCPRNFSAATIIAECEVVSATQQPGDACTFNWECTTHFCKNTVCANPIPEGGSCAAGEPCQGMLACVSDVCKALQPDGAACVAGTECISGACGGGQCVNSPTYTCDGQ